MSQERTRIRERERSFRVERREAPPVDRVRVADALRDLTDLRIRDWEGIDVVLEGIGRDLPSDGGGDLLLDPRSDLRLAFATFDFGIDGVSMEIAKYATCLEELKQSQGAAAKVHCIGGDFSAAADIVLRPHWERLCIPDCNGWAKWGDGATYAQLYLEAMPEGSNLSRQAAETVWAEAVGFTTTLVDYLLEHEIELLVPVNVLSNPGNLAYSLALVLASEILGLFVLDSCHDFYWEAGAPASERAPGESPGPRDHFFTNSENRPFFRVFQRLLPWKGPRWHHLTINAVQAGRLVRDFGFDPSQVSLLGTFVEPMYFVPCRTKHKEELRQRLAYILGHGERVISTMAVHRFWESIGEWMENQRPVVCTSSGGDSVLNIMHPTALWLLQPTRIIGRKRIERDIELIEALMDFHPFRALFDDVPELTITLHITGPAPIEHREDLMRVVHAYTTMVKSLPKLIARRIFLALSAGKLGHSAFGERGHENLVISDLYKLSDLVLLPSETEGRGLPIVEAAAAGVPIVCARYEPEEVYRAVVGEDLPPSERIELINFPESRLTTAFLQEVTDALFLPQGLDGRALHNRRVVASRFGVEALQECFIRGMKGASGD